MLQSKEIGKVLSQGLAELPGNYQSSVLERSPLGVALLSSGGHPLTTVVNEAGLTAVNTTSDALHIYSIIGYNHLSGNSGDTWAVCELNEELSLMTVKIDIGNSPMYLMILYHKSFSKGAAKLKLDNMASVLKQGLTGYDSN